MKTLVTRWPEGGHYSRIIRLKADSIGPFPPARVLPFDVTLEVAIS